MSVSQSEALQPVFDGLYLKRETPFPTGNYDHVIVPGAVQIGNNNRIQFVKQAVEQGGVITGDIVLLGGLRPVFGEGESHLLEEDLGSIRE